MTGENEVLLGTNPVTVNHVGAQLCDWQKHEWQKHGKRLIRAGLSACSVRSAGWTVEVRGLATAGSVPGQRPSGNGRGPPPIGPAVLFGTNILQDSYSKKH
jgi:hypothetical protein